MQNIYFNKRMQNEIICYFDYKVAVFEDIIAVEFKSGVEIDIEIEIE